MNTIAKILMVLSMSTALAACDPEGGQMAADGGKGGAGGSADGGQPMGGGSGSRGGLSGDGGQPAGVAQFLGAWQYISLAAQVSCSDGSTATDDTISGMETFSQGSTPTEIAGVDDNGCKSVCVISGATATCQTGGTGCGDGLTISSDVYTYSNGTMREESTAQFTSANGSSCSVSGEAILTRVQ